MQWKRKVFLYNEAGDIEHTFDGLVDAKKFLVCLGFSENKLYQVIKSEEPFLGCVWVPDPDFELSIPCTAYNPETGETINYSSISKCGNDICGREDLSSGQRVRKAIDSGGKLNGWIITEDENNFINYNHPDRSFYIGEKQRPVFKVSLETENIIEKYDSYTLAAAPIYLKGTSISSVGRIRDGILKCAKEERLYAYKYTWIFVEDWFEDWNLELGEN